MNKLIKQDFVSNYVFVDPNCCMNLSLDEMVGSTSIQELMKHFGWTYLHYACRFCSADYTLICDLAGRISATPDKFGRYPLHLACEGNAPVEVITLLLKNEDHLKSIHEATNICKVSNESIY